MLTFAANLSWMFKEHDFLDRFAAAADAGFEWVEYLFPYDHDPEDVAERLSRHKLKLALFNAPPGDLSSNERGFACIPSRRADFRSAFGGDPPMVNGVIVSTDTDNTAETAETYYGDVEFRAR